MAQWCRNGGGGGGSPEPTTPISDGTPHFFAFFVLEIELYVLQKLELLPIKKHLPTPLWYVLIWEFSVFRHIAKKDWSFCRWYTYSVWFWFWISEDVVYSYHLPYDGPIAQWVANGRQPAYSSADSSSSPYVCSRDSDYVGVYVQDDGPRTNQVVQVGAAQLDHSVGIYTMWQYVTVNQNWIWIGGRSHSLTRWIRPNADWKQIRTPAYSVLLHVTHFLFLKTKLKIKQTVVKTMPAVAKRTSTAVVAGCTVTVVFSATPSRGKPATSVCMDGSSYW